MMADRFVLGLRFWVLFLAGSLFLDLVFLLVVVIPPRRPTPMNIGGGCPYPLFYIFAGGLVSSIVLGLFWFVLRYPQHSEDPACARLLITTGCSSPTFTR